MVDTEYRYLILSFQLIIFLLRLDKTNRLSDCLLVPFKIGLLSSGELNYMFLLFHEASVLINILRATTVAP